MAAANIPNVWTQMNYVPPRGQCNFKQSFVSVRCPCLRFMLHPLKSASSYECDGCSHHASFHSMENRVEDEIKKRWEQEAKDNRVEDEMEKRWEQEAKDNDAEGSRPRKRQRKIEYNGNGFMGALTHRLLENGALDSVGVEEAGASKAKAKKKPAGKATRARGKVIEVMEDDEEYIELD